MRVFHSVVIREKPPSKRPRKQSRRLAQEQSGKVNWTRSKWPLKVSKGRKTPKQQQQQYIYIYDITETALQNKPFGDSA